MKTPEQEAKAIAQTEYGRVAEYTTPIVKNIAEKLAHRAGEFMILPIDVVVKEVYDVIYIQVYRAVTDKCKNQDEACNMLHAIATRWATEHVMQSIETSKRMKEYMQAAQSSTVKPPNEAN
jgi:hypothetical protein